MLRLDVWLYGSLASLAQPENRSGGHAHLPMEMPDGTTMGELSDELGLTVEEKGITFINGQLADMPGMSADREIELKDGDRVAVFDRRSMWPFQYRHGVSISPQLSESLKSRDQGAICHSSGGPGGEAGTQDDPARPAESGHQAAGGAAYSQAARSNREADI